MILTCEEVVTITLKVISATIKMILATDEVLTATLKVISATTTVILATEEVISVTLKVISATTKVILTTNNLMSARKSDLGHLQTVVRQFKGYLSHYKVIWATEEVITATFKNI